MINGLVPSRSEEGPVIVSGRDLEGIYGYQLWTTVVCNTGLTLRSGNWWVRSEPKGSPEDKSPEPSHLQDQLTLTQPPDCEVGYFPISGSWQWLHWLSMAWSKRNFSACISASNKEWIIWGHDTPRYPGGCHLQGWDDTGINHTTMEMREAATSLQCKVYSTQGWNECVDGWQGKVKSDLKEDLLL